MAHFHIKKKKGRPYLYVREIARVGGKPKVINQTYIGPPERVAAMATGETKEEKMLRVEEFGALWLAQQMDSDVDLAGIVDELVPRASREKGPSVGEYFLYCIFNRMVEARSKNRLAEWYRTTAIQHIRPVEIEELTSMRYWEKWNRVTEQALETIARRFFKRIWELEDPDADCLLFDTTNYYTFMASDTASELAVRGKNKAGRHNLRQIGLGLLVARYSRLPLYYRIYPGNMHDSRLFRSIMDEMFGVVCGFHKTKERLTVIFDKGMNAEQNYEWIDEHRRIHFITNYSTCFSEELVMVPLSNFEVVDTAKNRLLVEKDKPEDCMLAYRTSNEYWGKERSVIVTYNPATARKQNYTFDSKLDVLREELLTMRRKVREREPHWREPDKVRERYFRLCERLHISSDFYSVETSSHSMSFTRNVYRVEQKRKCFGKNIIITDNTDWSTAEIVEANLDRREVENRFRLSKNDEFVSVSPLRHWTDSKIRCHLFSCVVSLTLLRRIELHLLKAGIRKSSEEVMEDMNNLHSVLFLKDGRSAPKRKLEVPTKTQREVLTAFGYEIDSSGVLQPLPR